MYVCMYVYIYIYTLYINNDNNDNSNTHTSTTYRNHIIVYAYRHILVARLGRRGPRPALDPAGLLPLSLVLQL